MKSKLYYIFAMVIFGSIGLFVRGISLSSSQIALGRGIIGSLFLFVIFLISQKKPSFTAIKKNIVLLLLSGTAIGFNWILLFQAYKYTSISNATLSYYFAPVFVMMVSPFFLKEKLTGKKVVCILLAVLGMFIVSNGGNVQDGGSNELLGIIYGLMAAVLYASVVIINKFYNGLSGLELTLIQLMIASLVLFPYVLATDPVKISGMGGKTLLFLLFIGIVHTGMAYFLYFSGLQKLKGQTAAVLSYIDPVSAIFMSAFLLGEPFGWKELIGGSLILGAAFLVTVQPCRKFI